MDTVCSKPQRSNSNDTDTGSSISVDYEIDEYLYFSKLYYRDLHSPILTTAVSSIITTVQQRLPLYFKLQRLQTPNHLGGFGLMNPNHQVKGRRGKQIYLLYTQEDDLIIKFMRTKIQDILDNIAKDYNMPTEPDKLIVYPWYFLGWGILSSVLQFRYLKERI